MKNKYYIISKEIADELGISEYRYGNGADGYLVNSGDLAGYDVGNAIAKGAREVTAKEAAVFANHNK